MRCDRHIGAGHLSFRLLELLPVHSFSSAQRSPSPTAAQKAHSGAGMNYQGAYGGYGGLSGPSSYPSYDYKGGGLLDDDPRGMR